MCSKRLTPATADAIFVVSDSGDILSPKYAPEITAPAAIPVGIPRPSPIPISAIPTVPAVPHEVPVESETIAQMIHVATRNIPGERIPSP